MKLLLGHDEKIIKNWNYSLNSNATIMVTNKRIVSICGGSESLRYAEVPIESVKTICCQYEKNANRGGIVEIILGSLLIPVIASGIFLNFGQVVKIIFGVLLVPAIIFGILLIRDGISRLNRGMFNLVITTVGGEGNPIRIRTNSQKPLLARRNKLYYFENDLTSFASVGKLNISVIDEICESLGSIVINQKK